MLIPGNDLLERVRLAIIGCGAFAHLYHVPALRELPDVDLVGIADPSPSDATAQLAERTGAVLLDHADLLLGRVEVDAVLVSSPHGLHAEHVEAALQAGKHVLVDKPFVLSSRDAVRLAELARSQRCVGAVAFNRRLDDAYRRARASLEQGLLGVPRHIDSTQLGYPSSGWIARDPALAGGGPFLGRGAHLADAVPWLVGADVRGVRGWVDPPLVDGGVDRGGYWDVDLDGVTWRATILAEGPGLYDEVRVFGDLGWLSLRRPSTFAAWPPSSDLTGLPPWELSTSVPERRSTVGDSRPVTEQSSLADFVAAIVEEREPSCSFEAAYRSVRLVEAAYVSVESGNSVVEL